MPRDIGRIDAPFDPVAMDDPNFLRQLEERGHQCILEAEMATHLNAARYERSEGRQGCRNGYKPRLRSTRVGTLTLSVPQGRVGVFFTQRFVRQ